MLAVSVEHDKLQALCGRLQPRFGPRFSLNQTVRNQHCQTTTWLKGQAPDAVVFPESTEEVSSILQQCHALRVPVIPFGNGSSLEGQVNAPFGGICVDLSRMDQVQRLWPDDLHVAVQPGVMRHSLNQYLRNTGLFFPIDPGADASLGGMAATRASGTNAVRYGTMRENVLGVEVVLADGKIIRTGTRARKSSAGYDLTKLFVGSEGTLGIITELTLQLYGLPQSIVSGVCSFRGINEACQTVMLARQLGVDLARIELLDETSVRACNRYSHLTMTEAPTLFLEFHGTPEHTAHTIADFVSIAADFGAGDMRWAESEQERAALWKARHDAWWAIHALFPGTKGVTTDACVPISRLADCIDESWQDIQASGLSAAVIGHVGDGNFHVLLLIDMDSPAETERAHQFIGRMSERAIAMGGTCTGEHGIGQGKMACMPLEHGDSLACMRAVKSALDPTGIMNPGKLFDA